MHIFFLKLRIIGELLLGIILGYMGFAMTFPYFLVNLILITLGFCSLIQAFDNVDKAEHLGKYKTPPENSISNKSMDVDENQEQETK